MMNTRRQHLVSTVVVVLAVLAPAVAAQAAIFSNSTSFTNAVGAMNLTTQDFEGFITPPATEAIITEIDGVTFTTSGSDVIVITDFMDGYLQNGEQDRNIEITFPEPVAATSVSMKFLNWYNNPTVGGEVMGEAADGTEVFSVSQPPGSFFVGYVGPAAPISKLFLLSGGGGRAVVDTFQYAVTADVPEPSSGVMGLLAILGSLATGRRGRR